MARHRSHSVAFKRQVAAEFIAGEALHALSKRHDISRQLIRIWVGKFEAGALDDDVQAADLLQEYEAKLTVVGQAKGFTGQTATTSTSGADGVVIVTSSGTTTLFAGNGNSTLLSFNVSNPAAPTPLFAPINTGGNFRVDEMAYSPSSNLVLVANNADTPAFATLINATSGTIVAGHIIVPNTPVSGGLEQPVWDSDTGTFFVSVPAFNGSGNPGGIAEIGTNGTVLRTFNFGTMGLTSCSSTGLALGASGNLLVGCGNAHTQAVLFNPAGNGGAGSIVTTFSQISSTDEI